MEYDIIKNGENEFIISDSYKVMGFNQNGKIHVTGLPDLKTFRELAYIVPPITVIASSFEDAVRTFIAYV